MVSESAIYENLIEVIEEGANMEITKSFMSNKKAFKTHNSNLKKALKGNDFATAKAELKKMKADVKAIEKTINENDSDVGSAVFGYFATGLVNTLELFVPSLIYSTGATISASSITNAFLTGDVNPVKVALGGFMTGFGYTFTLIKSIIILVQEISEVVKAFQKKEGAANALNLYRGKIKTMVKKLNDSIDTIEKNIEKREKAAKN